MSTREGAAAAANENRHCRKAYQLNSLQQYLYTYQYMIYNTIVVMLINKRTPFSSFFFLSAFALLDFPFPDLGGIFWFPLNTGDRKKVTFFCIWKVESTS